MRARTDGPFDAQEPLRGRFIHYWPRPYGDKRRPAVLKQAEASPLGVEMDARAMDERTRLLYVTFTRARDVLVLPVTLKSSATAWTDEVNASDLLLKGAGDIPLPDGNVVRRLQRVYSQQDIAAAPPAKQQLECRWFAAQPILEHAPLWLRPSGTTGGNYRIDLVEPVGARIRVTGDVDMAALGSALHNAIALHATQVGQPASAEEVAAILKRWQVDAAVEVDEVLSQAVALLEWVRRKWLGAQVQAEVPLEVMLPSGRVVRGQIDLLVDLEDGWVVVDHKADPRSVGHDDRLAQAHGLQLEAYSQALLAATGRPVRERWLYLPVAGQAVRIVVARADGSVAVT